MARALHLPSQFHKSTSSSSKKKAVAPPPKPPPKPSGGKDKAEYIGDVVVTFLKVKKNVKQGMLVKVQHVLSPTNAAVGVKVSRVHDKFGVVGRLQAPLPCRGSFLAKGTLVHFRPQHVLSVHKFKSGTGK